MAAKKTDGGSRSCYETHGTMGMSGKSILDSANKCTDSTSL